MNWTGIENIYRRVLEQLAPAPGDCILDVGGGTGTLAMKLIEQGVRVAVVDTSLAMLDQAAKKGIPEAWLFEEDAADLPFPPDSFDAVLCTDALHHFADRESSLREMTRVLKDRGQLLIVDFDHRNWKTRLLARLERLLGEDSRFYSPQELESILSDLGLLGGVQSLDTWQFLYTGRKSGE